MKPYYQDDAVTIYHGDCLELLPGIAGADLVVTAIHRLQQGVMPLDAVPKEAL